MSKGTAFGKILQSNPDYEPYYGESDDEDSADQDANMANLKVATDIGERLQVEVFKKLLRCPRTSRRSRWV